MLVLQSKTALKNAGLALTADTLGQIRGLLNTVFAETSSIEQLLIHT